MIVDLDGVDEAASDTCYSLYKRGKIWWARVGNANGKPIRISCRTANKSVADKVARKASDGVLQQERSSIVLRAVSKASAVPAWLAFVESAKGSKNVRRMYLNARQRSRARKAILALEEKDVVALLIASNGYCAITGLPFTTDASTRRSMQPSLDRIDNSKQYEAGNLRVVALAANLAMNIWGEDQFMQMALGAAAVHLQNEAQGITISRNVLDFPKNQALALELTVHAPRAKGRGRSTK